MVTLAAATMMLSAGLTFSVQPLLGRLILPYFGGVPSVWNTVMLFFQAALLLGYGYAHLLAQRIPLQQQVAVHGALLLLSMLFLPVALPDGWSPQDGQTPPLAIIPVLSASIGVPFVVASATAPLLQSWYARSRAARSSDPYFLYAASNVGSLLGLISYPLLIEPRFGLFAQGRLWSLGFGLLTAGTLACGLMARNGFRARQTEWEGIPDTGVSWRQRLHWMALAAAPASLLIAVTQHVSTNITAMPLLWVAPLTLYLATFIIAFTRRTALPDLILAFLVPCAATVAIAISKVEFAVLPGLTVHYSILFLLALFCHADLYARRPAASRLTEFYFWMSVGGLLGTGFNTFVAPLVFSGITEYPLAIAAILLLWALRYDSGGAFRPRAMVIPVGLFLIFRMLLPPILGYEGAAALEPRMLGAAIAFAPGQRPLTIALSVAAVLFGILGHDGETYIHRSFFGVHRVRLDSAMDTLLLVHGDTIHGAQSRQKDLQREPLTYYGRKGPVGQLFGAEGPRFQRIGAVGLGTASIACYGREGTRWTFFEIDAAIVQTAQSHFSYLSACAPEAQVVLGDGRLLLAREPDGAFDLLIIDAFSSDAVPLHLLTREAIQLYVKKLSPRGLLMIHTSSRYMRLTQVVVDLIRDAGLEGRVQYHRPEKEEVARYVLQSDWVVAGRNAADLGSLATDERWSVLPARRTGRIWTDDYANVTGAVIWTGQKE
jgi:hypothetical protein